MLIHETRETVATRAKYRCEVCGKPTPMNEGQLAHRIPQRKWCIKKWGIDVIHHPLNMAWTCGLACNNIVSIGGWPVRQAELVEEIREAMNESVSE